MKKAKKESTGSNKKRPGKLKAREEKTTLKRGGRKRSRLTIANPNAAGIDIGGKEHFAGVPEGRDEETVRSFSPYSEGLEQMVEWFRACGITTVAMESTGSYWIPVFARLELAGFKVILVDARSVKNVPGRKTDVLDCQWIQRLHSYGLLSAAFRPEDAICRVRTLQRHRKNMVEMASKQVQHIQKELCEMNLYLHHVLSDITGESGLRIIEAILAGERDPVKLAKLVNGRVKKSKKEIAAALSGDYREECLFVMEQCLKGYHHLQEQISALDQRLFEQLTKLCSAKPVVEAESLPAPVAEPALTSKERKRTSLERKQAEELKRIAGTDLTKIEGLDVLGVQTIISEIGTDMTRWRNEKAFASWLGLCPGSKISGGRVLSSKTRKVISRTATVLRTAALTISRSKTKTSLGAFHRRMKARRGDPKAITATARKIACLVYRLLRSQAKYQPQDLNTYEHRFRDQMVASLRKRASGLGFNLVELPMAA